MLIIKENERKGKRIYMEKLTLRTFEKGDTEAAVEIIRRTWHYDRFCNPGTARRLAKIFLLSCLANQTYTGAALQGDRLVGLIMGKDAGKHRTPAGCALKLAAEVVRLFLSAEGRKVMKLFGGVRRIDAELLRESGMEYQGEISFFAVAEEARGSGIGKLLFQHALGYMKRQGVDRFFLFTDTSCSYGFYEHQGLCRRVKKTCVFRADGRKETMEFYIYDNQPAAPVSSSARPQQNRRKRTPSG